MPLLEILGHSQASLGHFLVRSLSHSHGSLCARGSVCAVQESISQSCVSSGSSMVGLMLTSSKVAYVIPKPAAPSHTQAAGLRSPAPAAVHCWPMPLQEMPKHSFPGGPEGKASACNAGDLGSTPGPGRSPAEGNGNPLWYSCLEKSHGLRIW